MNICGDGRDCAADSPAQADVHGLDKKSRKAFLGCHIACPDCKSETVDFRRMSMLFEGVFPLFQNKIYIHARCQQP